MLLIAGRKWMTYTIIIPCFFFFTRWMTQDVLTFQYCEWQQKPRNRVFSLYSSCMCIRSSFEMNDSYRTFCFVFPYMNSNTHKRDIPVVDEHSLIILHRPSNEIKGTTMCCQALKHVMFICTNPTTHHIHILWVVLYFMCLPSYLLITLFYMQKMLMNDSTSAYEKCY